MQRSDFDYQLPNELIAQRPLAKRSASRLLCLDAGQCKDRHFGALVELLRAGDRLVLNDTKVIPARLHGKKASGGRVEILIERLTEARICVAQIRASKTPKVKSRLWVADPAHEAAPIEIEVLGRADGFYELQFHIEGLLVDLLDRIGHIPLPPYIERADESGDKERYQTVFARTAGAVAAPTAGLHFDQALLATLAQKGVQHSFVTLHVGAGTFQPIRCDNLAQHQMHAERVQISPQSCAEILATKAQGGRVIAVGTTVVRTLESASSTGKLSPYQGETRLFIRPGYPFQTVDALVTNFHLPASTLLMLVCAFGGYQEVMAAYQHAVAERYRFFSYGDAMFLLANRNS